MTDIMLNRNSLQQNLILPQPSAIGALSLACLKPSDISETMLSEKLQQWFQQGNGTALTYLEKNKKILEAPFSSRPWAKSAIILCFLPQPAPDNPLRKLPPAQAGRPSGSIAWYALNRDYHLTGMDILERLQVRLRDALPGDEVRFEGHTDAGPTLEKALAMLGGLGIYGRNQLLSTPDAGCSVHLAILFTSLELPSWHRDGSGSGFSPCLNCGRCLQNCPGKVLGSSSPDFRNCCSFLTNEYSGALNWQQQLLLDGRLLGCSECTRACPTSGILGQDYLVDAEGVLRLGTRELEKILRGTAAEHSGATRIKRNAAAALGIKLSPDQRKQLQPELLNICHSPAVRQTILNWP